MQLASLVALLAGLTACGTPAPAPGSDPPATPAPAVRTPASDPSATPARGSATPVPTVGAPAATDAGPATAASTAPAPLDAAPLLRDAGARGAVLALDVDTGAIVARGGVDRDPAAPVLPLSVVKLYTAALWWDQQLGDGDFPHPRRPVRVSVHDVLVDGYDRPGELIALELRRRMTGARVLSELRRYGLGPTLTLAVDASDATWGSVLSLGEDSVRVTLASVSGFLRAVGRSELVRPETARRLHAAMRDTVTRGTARSAAARVPAGWHLGGKTGTGPGMHGKPYDGWFAGLIFEGDRPRYTIAVYIDRGGLGGGVAAAVAAAVARALAAAPAAPASPPSP